jgi:hypothetical protein
MDEEIRTVIIDLVAMLTVYATGRDNNETRGQALSTIRDARALLSKMQEDEQWN